jgi:hypothetical protein
MMQAGLAAFQAGTTAWQAAMAEMMKNARPPAEKRSGAQASGQQVFGEMLEPGLRLSEAYRREMDAILARLWPDAKGS